jgi:hypothetical protein
MASAGPFVVVREAERPHGENDYACDARNYPTRSSRVPHALIRLARRFWMRRPNGGSGAIVAERSRIGKLLFPRHVE